MRLLVCSASALAVLLCIACGSKSDDEATADDEVNAIQRTDPAPTPSDPSATPAADPGTAAPAVDGGAPSGEAGPGPVPASEAGAPVDNPLCAPASVREAVGNDSAATANALPGATSSFCGTLGTAADVDFVTFVLPADAKSLGFGAEYSAQGLAIKGTVAGQTFDVGGSPVIKPGQKYVFEIHTSGSSPVSYRFDVSVGK
jgi:hypothetical protein